jgi:hypothetical protein
LDASLLKKLRDKLQPGDVLLVRAEQKLTSAILPGFWAHAALFVASVADLEASQIAGEASVARHLKRLSEQDEGLGCVIEAISPRVQVSSLQFCLCADHVAVLRPRLPQAEIREILIEAFGYLNVPYDFEFDFNLRTRVVCTGLIYRCFHNRGTVRFALTKRLGRYTLSGDDLMNQWIAGLDQPASDCPMPFELVALALKAASGEAAFVEQADAAPALRQIREGWRPTRGPITALAQPHN